MINIFQQRDFGDKINTTFQYISQNFRSLGLSLLYIAGPVALVAGIASGIFQSNILKMAGSRPDPDADPPEAFGYIWNFFSPAFWVTVLFAGLATLAVSLVTYAHMKRYAHRNASGTDTASISVSEVWEEVQPAIGRAIIISVLGAIISGIGFIFLFIPGLYLAIVLSLALAITTFEGTDFDRTWERCFKLIRDKWWSTFGLVFIMGLITAIVGMLFTLPGTIISFLAGARLLPDVASFWVVLGSVISTVGSALVRALLYVAIGFQYSNLVERQEGRGLLSAIDSIGTTPTAPRSQDEGDY